MTDPANQGPWTPAPPFGRVHLEVLDLSPMGLAGAPASRQDQDSLVYIGVPD
jgi:hypothetical protein